MSITNDIFTSLTRSPKTLADLQWLHYDEEGSLIFEKITLQDEYYVTSRERLILESKSDEIIAKAAGESKRRLRIVELGAGTATKTGILLASAVKYQGFPTDYLPVDVSPTALAEAQSTLTQLIPGLCIVTQTRNYLTEPLMLSSFDGCTLVVSIGSSISNLSRDQTTRVLDHARHQLKPGDALLLGVDMCQDPAILVPAYDDKNGVTAAFHVNVLRRLNREFGYSFDLEKFRYRAVWNERESRVEKHLESLCSQQVKGVHHGEEVTIDFDVEETIHIENSYKFNEEQLRMLLANADFEIEHIWHDEQKWVTIILARIPVM